MHHVEPGDSARLVGLTLTQGGVARLLERGVSEAELGLDTLRAMAQRTFGDQPARWYFSYRVRIGVR